MDGAPGSSGPTPRQRANVLAQQAWQFHTSGRPDLAERTARDALSLVPDHPFALRTLAAAVESQDRHAEAIDIAKAAIAAEPEHPFPHGILANALANHGLLEAARTSANRMVELNHTGMNPYLVRASVLRRMRRFAEAETDARIALEKGPTYWGAYNDLAAVLMGMRRYDEAVVLLNEAVKLSPNESLPHLNLARIHRVQMRHGKALESARAALEAAPGDSGVVREFEASRAAHPGLLTRTHLAAAPWMAATVFGSWVLMSAYRADGVWLLAALANVLAAIWLRVGDPARATLGRADERGSARALRVGLWALRVAAVALGVFTLAALGLGVPLAVPGWALAPLPLVSVVAAVMGPAGRADTWPPRRRLAAVRRRWPLLVRPFEPTELLVPVWSLIAVAASTGFIAYRHSMGALLGAGVETGMLLVVPPCVVVVRAMTARARRADATAVILRVGAVVAALYVMGAILGFQWPEFGPAAPAVPDGLVWVAVTAMALLVLVIWRSPLMRNARGLCLFETFEG